MLVVVFFPNVSGFVLRHSTFEVQIDIPSCRGLTCQYIIVTIIIIFSLRRIRCMIYETLSTFVNLWTWLCGVSCHFLCDKFSYMGFYCVQVYQPTEEELRSYLDPYENIICTECHQGDDDGLMLLCDLCDSSAHTYCVGLGREVPEGNWYCEGCRPVALGSASFQTHITSEQQRVSGFYSRQSPPVVSGQYQDVSLLVSPRTPFFNGENLFSPRLPNGDVQGSSPSGLGATTLSRRRTLHRHIQNIINSDRLINMGARTGGTSIANSSDGSVATQIGHGRTIDPSQPAASQETGVSLYTISEERLPNNNSLISAHDPELLSPKLDEFGSEEAFRRLSNNTFLGERPIDLGLHHGLAQGDPLFSYQQHLHSYMPNTMSSMAGERLQQRVKAHLKNLSSQIDLGTHNPILSSSSWFTRLVYTATLCFTLLSCFQFLNVKWSLPLGIFFIYWFSLNLELGPQFD